MRLFLLVALVLCIVCSIAYADERSDTQVFSESYIKSHLQSLADVLPSLKAKLDKLKARRQDISYPMVSYTVLKNFIGYVDEDASKGELERASMQLTEMGNMGRKLDKELDEALAGKRKFPAVPRWTGKKRPVIKKSSFIAPTATFGKPGIETRPVFFNGYGHFSQVRADIEKFPDYGINIIQIEIGPSSILPEENKINTDPIPDLLKLLDRAEKAGVMINLLISPHYVPQWVTDKIKRDKPGFHGYCLRAPESKEMLKRYIGILIPPLKDHPALHSICLSNEPSFGGDSCEYAVSDWHAWLKNKHGDIATLNTCWGTNYKSFDDVQLPSFNTPEERKPIGKWVDYVRFNQESHAVWQKMLADAVHAAAPNLPVHIKVQTPTLIEHAKVYLGNDAYLLGNVTDISGNDSTNIDNSYSRGELAENWIENSSGHDLQRSVKDAPVFDSENHLIWDRYTRYVPAEHIRCALWQQAIHGQSATTIWVWERTFDKKSDFYGSIMHRPACAAAVGTVNYDLNRAAKEVTAIQQAPPQVLILHDTSAMIYDGESYESCWRSLYMALDFSGVKIGFATERQLEDGLVPKASVLIIPKATHISDAAFLSLQKYKGHIIMLGGDNLLAYNEYDKQRTERLIGNYIPYDNGKTTMHEIRDAIKSLLNEWNVRPVVELSGKDGNPAWGVQWRGAVTANGTLVNICNYLKTPVSLKMSRGGKAVSGVDVLTGESVSSDITLQPLEVKLIRLKG